MDVTMSLIAVLNNQQIDQRDQAANAEPAPADPHAGLMSRLAAYLETCWQAAKSAKVKIEEEMLEDLRQREGFYSPEKLAAIKSQGGSEIYMLLTNFKCRAAEGWLRDVLFPPGDRPFYVRPTPSPDLPPEVMLQLSQAVTAEAERALAEGLHITEEAVYRRGREVGDQIAARLKEDAATKAERMEDKIDDLFVHGKWYSAMEGFINDLVVFPSAIIKGPVIRKERKLGWGADPRTGRSVPQATDELRPVWYAVNPFDLYPAPDSRDPDDGYLFERISVRRSALHRMIGVPGYNEQQIRAALEEYRHGFSLNISIEQQRRELENSDDYWNTPDKSLDVLEFTGAVPGWMLIEWGMDAARVPDPQAEYEASIWKLGRFVVRTVLNEDPLGRRPYLIASFDRVAGQFWGRGLTRLIRDVQDMCNAAARALVNNMGLSSGPLIEVEADRLAEGEEITSIAPWRILQTRASKVTPSPAVRFHDIPSNAKDLIGVFQFFSQLADTYSGVTAYDAGINQTRGAAGTASGLSMLMNASSRTIKRVVSNIDDVIAGSCYRAHTHVMLHDEDEAVKGDTEIEARGASALVVKEQQQIRRNEFLQATMNPIDMEILGQKGRAELLREAVRTFDLNPDKLIPHNDELTRRMREAMAAEAQALPGPAAVDAGGNAAGGRDAALFAA
jgi:hypothetical protein